MRARLLTLGVLAVLVGAHSVGVLAPVERPLAGVLLGVSGALAENLLGIQQWFRSSEDSPSLEARLAELEHDLASCALRTADSASLQVMEQTAQSRSLSLIPARIIGVSPDAEHSFLIIDRGTEHGVKQGSGVIAEKGVFLGKVITAERFSSMVLLPTDRRSKIIATFANTEPSRGVVEGQFQVGLRMNLIPITEVVERNQLVVTSGLQTDIPPVFDIGRVRDIQSKPTDLFKSASIEPAIDYNRVRLVSVVSGGAKK